jgi:hypothetical protein
VQASPGFPSSVAAYLDTSLSYACSVLKLLRQSAYIMSIRPSALPLIGLRVTDCLSNKLHALGLGDASGTARTYPISSKLLSQRIRIERKDWGSRESKAGGSYKAN